MWTLTICIGLTWATCNQILQVPYPTEAACWAGAEQYLKLNTKPAWIYCKPQGKP